MHGLCTDTLNATFLRSLQFVFINYNVTLFSSLNWQCKKKKRFVKLIWGEPIVPNHQWPNDLYRTNIMFPWLHFTCIYFPLTLSETMSAFTARCDRMFCHISSYAFYTPVDIQHHNWRGFSRACCASVEQSGNDKTGSQPSRLADWQPVGHLTLKSRDDLNKIRQTSMPVNLQVLIFMPESK